MKDLNHEVLNQISGGTEWLIPLPRNPDENPGEIVFVPPERLPVHERYPVHSGVGRVALV